MYLNITELCMDCPNHCSEGIHWSIIRKYIPQPFLDLLSCIFGGDSDNLKIEILSCHRWIKDEHLIVFQSICLSLSEHVCWSWDKNMFVSVAIICLPKLDKFLKSGMNVGYKFFSSWFSDLWMLISRQLEKLLDYFAFVTDWLFCI